MNTFIKHTFNKPWYSHNEIPEVFSISDTWLKLQMRKLVEEGGDLSVMGHFIIDGKREACFFPQLLMDWIVNNKILTIAKYDYEKLEQDKLHTSLNQITQRGN